MSAGRWILLGARLACLVVILMAAGCSRQSTITVLNASSAELRNVVVSGTGFRESIPKLAPGQIVTLASHPRGDTGIAVEFDAQGRHVSAPPQDYAGGGGYRVEVKVSPELSVSVRSTLAA
jgi:hypothetical protein